jgi:hypothetical protein
MLSHSDRRRYSHRVATDPGITPTDLAAWVGAFAGVGALLWQVVTWRRSSHNVRVANSRAWFTYPNGRMGEQLVCITAYNTGSGAVTLTGWGVEIGKQNAIMVQPLVGSTPLPHRLDSGAEANFHMPADAIREYHERDGIDYRDMRPWVQLATGKKVYSRKRLLIP